MATATDFRPPWAVTMWADDEAIYLEIPAKDGPPFIQRYLKTEGGLSKALALMVTTHRKHQPKGGSYKIVNSFTRKSTINDFTQDQRETARAILRKHGLIGRR